MTDTQRVRDLFEIPEHIRKGDFVLKLAEGIDDPAATAKSYVVTPGLADAFDRALSLVGSALRDGNSHASYLHGSFGSGKSHFMALLSLLLSGNEEAWRLPALHPLRAKHSFVGTTKLLELHFHMVGQESIEGAVFSEYLKMVREEFPNKPIPPLFADEDLFDNARELLDEVGEEAFFEPLNKGAAADAGWGEIGGAWDRARFDESTQSSDPAVRAELFSELCKTRFKGWAQNNRGYVDFDSGLAIIANHAADLGYDGIVLFLDELILWLAGRAADAAWMHVETQKMVKLVEAGNMHRKIPLVSFIARQRNLAEMVGEDYAGVENVRLHESLKHWEGRYDTIVLEDNNLPAIVEQRILKTKDDAAKQALEQAFEKMRKGAKSSWSALLSKSDADSFRKLYPFSPALVDALVALSNSLQRQRTAIKLLMEILVDHIGDLKLGEVVRVGDLFDVMAGGQESADGVMRSRFEAAKQIYRYQFLDLIRNSNETNSEERCQRLRADHRLSLGCAGCPEKSCRTDNRLVKTLIIAALVPEVPALKDLTASKLVQLNHGTITVPVPGTEANIVAGKLRNWASAIGQLQLGGEADPTVRLRLEGVDVGPILDKSRHVDSQGARQRVIRDLLFDSLGLQKVLDKGKDHSVDWRNTKRSGHIYFGNVRSMPPAMLNCADTHDWRLVVDYPFDDGNFGPNDDVEVIERYMESGSGSWTLVWLPSFFSEASNKILGELVILEHILESRESAQRSVSDLSVENQTRAISDLENLRSMKKQKLRNVLAEAYGLAQSKGGDLDSSRYLDQHLWILKPGAKAIWPAVPSMEFAVDAYIDALLAARWPRHPNFSHKLTGKRIEYLLSKFGELIDGNEKRISEDRSVVDEMRGTLGELGLVRTTEGMVHLVEDRVLQTLENRRNQKAVDKPTVGEVRTWIDETGQMGLLPEVESMVVRAYARHAARTFVLYDRPVTPELGKALDDAVMLEKPELPPAAAWAKAIDMAGFAFGVSAGRALHADNLKRFEAELAVVLSQRIAPAAKLPGLLEEWASLLGVDSGADRLRSARSGDGLCASLSGQSAVAQVQALASFVPETSGRAMGTSLERADSVNAQLGNKLVMGVFQQLKGRAGDGASAGILERAAEALRQDEVNVALADRLRRLAVEGQERLAELSKVHVEPEPPKPPPPGNKTVADLHMNTSGNDAVRGELDRLVSTLQALLASGDELTHIQGSLCVRAKDKPKK